MYVVCVHTHRAEVDGEAYRVTVTHLCVQRRLSARKCVCLCDMDPIIQLKKNARKTDPRHINPICIDSAISSRRKLGQVYLPR